MIIFGVYQESYSYYSCWETKVTKVNIPCMGQAKGSDISLHQLYKRAEHHVAFFVWRNLLKAIVPVEVASLSAIQALYPLQVFS